MTGGAGFLGSFLSERLLAMGHEVLCLDNYYTGRKGNIAHLRDYENFEVIRHDVTVPFYAEVEGIFNLACPASPIHYQKNPVQTLKTSVLGALNMLDLAHRTGARFFQASTSEIYGDPEVSPQSETYFGRVNPIGIRACYDEGKRVAETLTFDHHRQYGLDIRVARIFNTYGPRMTLNDGRVVSNFIIQAIKGHPLMVYGDGSQTRSFCFVDDLIEGFIKLFFTEGIHEPVNLGNPSPVTMKALANEIIEITNSSSEIAFEPLPSDDPKLREPDITNAKTLLGWEPTVSRQDGIKRTFEDISGRIKSIDS